MIFFFLNCILDGREQTAWKINLMFALELLLSLDWENFMQMHLSFLLQNWVLSCHSLLRNAFTLPGQTGNIILSFCVLFLFEVFFFLFFYLTKNNKDIPITSL